MAKKYPENPEKVTDINITFMKHFFEDKRKTGELTEKDVKRFVSKIEKFMAEASAIEPDEKKAKKMAFDKYRLAFVKKYYPAILKSENRLVLALKKLY